MKLDDKIQDRKIAYAFRRQVAVAFELALLYFVSAKRKNEKGRIADACLRAIYWLKRAGVVIPDYLEELSFAGRLEEIEKLLAANKALIDGREYFSLAQLLEVNRILAKVDARISLT
ncbi:MAG: hypothetical protein WC903_06500 [Candidatus Margulisiibacteriota bacterium]